MPVDIEEINDKMTLMQVNFPYRNFCVIAIKIVSVRGISEKYEDDFKQEYALAEVRLRFEKLFNTEASLCGFYKKEKLVLGLVNFDYSEEHFKTLCQEFTMRFTYGYTVYVCSSDIVQDICVIMSTVQKAVEGLSYSYIYPEKMYFISAEINNLSKKNLNKAKISLKNFISSLKLGEYDRCLYELNLLVDKIRNEKYCIEDLNTILKELEQEIENMTNISTNIKVVEAVKLRKVQFS